MLPQTRNYKLSLTIVLAIALVISWQFPSHTPAHAGIFSSILRKSDDLASGAGKHVDNIAPSIGDSALIAKRLPDSSDSARLALVPDESGSWKLVTPDGDSQIVTDLGQIDSSISDLNLKPRKGLAGSPSIAADKLVKKIAIREADFFKLRGEIKNIPENTELHLIRSSGQTYRLQKAKILDQDRLVVELSKNTLLNPKNAKALDANINYLGKPVNQANLKIGRFEVAKTGSTPNLTDTLVDLDPSALNVSLARYKNRTLMISGKVGNHSISGRKILEVKVGGKRNAIDLSNLEKLAEQSRVNLMVVDANSATQPGKSWFSKSAIEKRFAKTDKAVTQGELLNTMSPPGTKTLIHAGEDGKTRIVMSTEYLQSSSKPTATSSGIADDYTLGTWLVSATTRVAIRSININAEDPEHTEEVESRWIPWISNIDLLVAAFFTAIFAFVSTTTWRWWKAIWRLIGRRSDHDFGKFARMARLTTFIPFAILTFVPGMIWLIVRDYVGFVTWPFRWLYSKVAT